jgi:hypothetical protein
MSLGFTPPPFIMFSQAANNEIDLSWTYQSVEQKLVDKQA